MLEIPLWLPVVVLTLGVCANASLFFIFGKSTQVKPVGPTIPNALEVTSLQLINDGLIEAQSKYLNEVKLATLNHRAAWVIFWGEVVLGAVLMSSFVKSLKDWEGLVGTLGILVLVCSLLRKQLKPEARTARHATKARAIKELISETNTLLANINGQQPDSLSYQAVQKRLSEKLIAIDRIADGHLVDGLDLGEKP